MDIKERLQNLTVAEGFTYGIVGIAAVIGLASLLSTAVKSGGHADAVLARQAQISQLKGELSTMSQEGTDGEYDGEEPEQVFYGSASAPGNAVAGLQDKFIRNPSNNPNITESALLEKESYSRQLEPYFSDGAKAEGSRSWYDPSYLYQTGTSNLFRWSFESNYSFQGESIPVLWLCRHEPSATSESKPVVAYATGVYDNVGHLFDNVSVHTTLRGSEMSGMPKAGVFGDGTQDGVQDDGTVATDAANGTETGEALDEGSTEAGQDEGFSMDEVQDSDYLFGEGTEENSDGSATSHGSEEELDEETEELLRQYEDENWDAVPVSGSDSNEDYGLPEGFFTN